MCEHTQRGTNQVFQFFSECKKFFFCPMAPPKYATACVQSGVRYGTKTWAMKAEILHSLEKMEQMMVRWMSEVSLEDI